MWRTLFGPGTWGAGGNLVAWVICGIPTLLIGLWRHRKAMHRRLDELERRLAGGEQPGVTAAQVELSGQDDEHAVFGFGRGSKPRGGACRE